MTSPEPDHSVTESPESPGSPTSSGTSAGTSAGPATTAATPATDVADVDEAAEILRRVFGYSSFRGAQREIVDHVVGGGDALVLMATGGGKSLCYQIPALVRAGVGVVVSPLIALMQDQVDALKAAGVNAAFLNSTLTVDQRREVERAFLSGELDLLY